MNRQEALAFLRADSRRILDRKAVARDCNLAEALLVLDAGFLCENWENRTVRMFLAHLPDITLNYIYSDMCQQYRVFHTVEQAALAFHRARPEHQPLLLRQGLRHSEVIALTHLDTRSQCVKLIKPRIDVDFDQIQAAIKNSRFN